MGGDREGRGSIQEAQSEAEDQERSTAKMAGLYREEELGKELGSLGWSWGMPVRCLCNRYWLCLERLARKLVICPGFET